MKKYIFRTIIFGVFILLLSCTDLNMVPLSQGSSEDWYSSKTEIEMALNDGYRMNSWQWAIDNPDADSKWTMIGFIAIVLALLLAEFKWAIWEVKSVWSNRYRYRTCHLILEHLKKTEELKLSEADVRRYGRGQFYTRLQLYDIGYSFWGCTLYYNAH